jgi:hypothetical protein
LNTGPFAFLLPLSFDFTSFRSVKLVLNKVQAYHLPPSFDSSG